MPATAFSESDHSTSTSFSAPLCVERHAEDRRNLAEPIAASLQAAGVGAAHAEPAGCGPETRYALRYLDNWSWDIRMYLAKLTLEVIDFGSGEILAYGEATQDSVSALGSDPRALIDRAVAALTGARQEKP